MTEPPIPPIPGGEEPLPPPRTSGAAIFSLVAGILGILFCPPFIAPIAALIAGMLAFGAIRANPKTVVGRGVATSGVILGILGLLLHLAGGVGIYYLAKFAMRLAENARTQFTPAVEAFKEGDLEKASNLLAEHSTLKKDEIKARVLKAGAEFGKVQSSDLAQLEADRSTGLNDIRLDMTWNLRGEKGDGHGTLQLRWDGNKWIMEDLKFEKGLAPDKYPDH